MMIDTDFVNHFFKFILIKDIGLFQFLILVNSLKINE